MREKVRAWLKEFRVLFLLFVTLPVFLGASIAYAYDPRSFSFFYFALSVIAMMSLHAGTIILNDYFDYMSGTDVLNKERTPYSGGSGLLPENVLKPGPVLAAGLLCFVLSILLGIYIVLTRSPAVMLIGMAGVIIGLFYTAPPLKLAYRGLGETARLVASPLIVLGAFFVQVPVAFHGVFDQIVGLLMIAFTASLPIAFLNTAALYIFEFPDYEADAVVGKRNLVVRLGRKNAVYLFLLLAALGYVSLLAGIALGLLPLLAGIALVAVPFSALASKGLMQNYDSPKGLVRYLKMASDAYVIASIALIIAFLL